MVTRFSAADAREKVERAKREAADRRKEAEALLKEQLLAQAKIKDGWEEQRLKIIDAAVDGADFFGAQTIYLPNDLLNLGFQLSERGVIVESIEEKNNAILSEYREDIFRLFEDFIYSIKIDVLFNREHLLSDFYEPRYQALSSAVCDEIDKTANLHHVLMEGLPGELAKKYTVYVDKIINALNAYTFYRADLEIQTKSQIKPIEENLVPGERAFNAGDSMERLLVPVHENNEFRVFWHSANQRYCLSEPLFSNEGIFWLSKITGQHLISQIFDALAQSAGNGRRKHGLTFQLEEEGWFFEREKGNLIFSCMPDELVELVERQGFTVYDTQATDHSYRIKVSW